MTTPSPEREVLTWELNGIACRQLAEHVAADAFVPDIILGIARGGLIPAGALAYALDCKLMISLNVEFYTGVGETLSEPVMLPQPVMQRGGGRLTFAPAARPRGAKAGGEAGLGCA